jgi:methionyl-tRNA formyltransferase
MRGRCVFFGYHTFGARALAGLLGAGAQVAGVVTHPDDPGEGDWFESVADVARAHAVPAITPASPNAPDVLAWLTSLDADVFVSVWYRRLLGEALLGVPRVAAVNLHGSLLPAYRGRAPLNWVLVNGERVTGVTLHHMTPEADAGDIVAQVPIDIAPDDTALTLYGRMVKVGVDLLLECYPGVLAGTAPRTPQDHARATVVRRRRAEDGRVSFTWPAPRIADMIRAVTHPYPGAFVGDADARLRLWEGRVEPGTAPGRPGTLLAIRDGVGIVVATGAGGLRLTRVQAAGQPELRADVWARAAGLAAGANIGGESA